MGRKIGGPQPTETGRRILELMAVYQVTNHAQFAEGVLGISRQNFHSWLYRPINAEKIAAKPILICADALGTNPEYLLCLSNDPRPSTALAYQESQLVQAFRDMSDIDKGRLLKLAADWVEQTETEPTTSSPFRTNKATNVNRS